MHATQATATLEESNRRIDQLIEHKVIKYVRTARKPSPSRAEWDSLVAQVRHVIQEDEPSALPNVAKLYDTLPISEMVKSEFRDAYDGFYAYLAQQSGFTIGGVSLRYGEVFDWFIYGRTDSRNQGKSELFDKWREHPTPSELVAGLYMGSLSRLDVCLSAVRGVNERVINELRSMS